MSRLQLTALFHLNPIQVYRIRRTHPSAAGRIERMLSVPTQLLSSILIGNTIVNVTASALAYVIAEQVFPSRGEAVAIPCMAVLLLLFGEVTPKRLAMSRPARLAALYAPVLDVLIRVATPLRALLEWVDDLIRRERSAKKQALTEDDFVLFYDEALQEFGLAVQGGGDSPVSIGVYGDLVGTFCSR